MPMPRPRKFKSKSLWEWNLYLKISPGDSIIQQTLKIIALSSKPSNLRLQAFFQP